LYAQARPPPAAATAPFLDVGGRWAAWTIWSAARRAHGSGIPGTASPAATEESEADAEAEAGLAPELAPDDVDDGPAEEPPQPVAVKAVAASRATAAKAGFGAGLCAGMGTE
jgi:hypothetical protein